MPIAALPLLDPPVAPERIAALTAELAAVDPSLPLLREPADLARLSRDYNDFSPVLAPLLQECRAQLVVLAGSVEQVIAVAGACARHGVPLTPRGAGTGNYGQCVPLRGGVVLDLSGLARLRAVDPASGVFTAEAGVILAELDRQLDPHGRALRLVPSTYRSATLGGFIAGGSSGIGSLRWGFLADPGNLLGLEVISVEPEPRRLSLGPEALGPLIHAYGCNGILTAVTMASCAAQPWEQLVVGFSQWSQALEVAKALPCTAHALNALCLLEAPVAGAMPWPGGCPPPQHGEHRLLLLASPDALPALPAWLQARGGSLRWQGRQGESRGIPIRELGWNHTTLHWRAQQPAWTYLQLLLPPEPAEMLAQLRQRWGDDLLWHLEAVRWQGAPRLAGLPLLRWQGPEALAELIEACRGLGALVFDPHAITVEDGGLGVVDADQVAFKRVVDPAGLLNPGKLRGWLSRSRG
jgi:FAD/FMN-containing dehydrogenase